MGADPSVRPAVADDIDAIQRIANLSWHAVYDDILGPDAVDEMLGEWYEAEAIEAGVDHDAQDFVVAVCDGRVLGYAHVGPHPPRPAHRLYRLYCHPDEWRSGIGRQLLAAVEQALFERDVQRYEAVALADNDAATSFYESTGFERVDERKTELAGVSVVEYIYRKRI
jgi:ribosomal protein S18 acetylase RimI-like enzyme